MATDRSDRLQELQDHLTTINKDTTQPLNEVLLKTAGPRFTGLEPATVLNRVLHLLISALYSVSDGHSVVVDLILELLRTLSFSECLQYTSAEDLSAALQASLVSVNWLALKILQKAFNSPHDAAVIAGMRGLVVNLVRMWLETADTLVAEEASDTILLLLSTDLPGAVANQTGLIEPEKPSRFPATGPKLGLFWRRLFEDEEIYCLLFSITSNSSPNSNPRTTRVDRSIAQSRLLNFIPKAAKMNFDCLEQSHFTETEKRYGCPDGTRGLLDYVSFSMVDREDSLMLIALHDFYKELIQCLPSLPETEEGPASESPCLKFLKSRKIHQSMIGLFFHDQSNQQEATSSHFLRFSSVEYIASYLDFHRAPALAETRQELSLIEELKDRIKVNLSSAHRKKESVAVRSNLRLLSAIPRTSLLPRVSSNTRLARATAWQDNPLSTIKLMEISAEILQSLGHLFRGPQSRRHDGTELTKGPEMMSRSDFASEGFAARSLFAMFFSNNPGFWGAVVTAAQSAALGDIALAANTFIYHIITADWQPDPGMEAPATLHKQQMLDWMSDIELPEIPGDGASAVLQPPALERVLPYLMSGQNRSSIPSSEEQEISISKHASLLKLHDILISKPSTSDSLAITSALRRRLEPGASATWNTMVRSPARPS